MDVREAWTVVVSVLCHHSPCADASSLWHFASRGRNRLTCFWAAVVWLEVVVLVELPVEQPQGRHLWDVGQDGVRVRWSESKLIEMSRPI